VDAGTDGIDREQHGSARLIVERQRLDEQQLRAFERPMLLTRHHRADDSRNLHLLIW
jgi:hypothetical protein